MMPPSERVPRSRLVLFWSIALGGAAFDLATKTAIFAQVGEPGPQAVRSLVPNVLELQTSFNQGALWGFGRSLPHSPLIFAGMSVIAAIAIYWYLFVLGAARDARLTAALGLIMAGALGNCYDRVRFGHVRDFMHFHVDAINFDCAIFNFADNMLVVGAVALMLLALRPDPDPGVEETPASSESSATAAG